MRPEEKAVVDAVQTAQAAERMRVLDGKRSANELARAHVNERTEAEQREAGEPTDEETRLRAELKEIGTFITKFGLEALQDLEAARDDRLRRVKQLEAIRRWRQRLADAAAQPPPAA